MDKNSVYDLLYEVANIVRTKLGKYESYLGYDYTHDNLPMNVKMKYNTCKAPDHLSEVTKTISKYVTGVRSTIYSFGFIIEFRMTDKDLDDYELRHPKSYTITNIKIIN